MHQGSGRMGTSAPTGTVNGGMCKWDGRVAVSEEHRRGRCPHRPANNHRTDRRRVKDAAPYGGDENSFDIKSAAARG